MPSISDAASLNNNPIQNDLDNFTKYIQSIIEEQKIPGMALAIVGKDKVHFEGYFGVEDVTSNKPITMDTTFQIASLSKAFLGVALANLSDKKIINWNDKLKKHIPEFKLKTDEYTDKLTLHHIASMQTGLPVSAGKEYLKDTRTKKDIIKIFANVESELPPGSPQFTYQYALLAALEELIARKTKIEWEMFVQRAILKHIGMRHTTFGNHHLRTMKNVAKPHDEHNKVVEFESFKVTSAAGVNSNMNDMIKWIKFHINNGVVNKTRLLSLKEVRNTRSPFTPMDEFIKEIYGNAPVSSLYYGYFWRNYLFGSEERKYKVIEHSGGCDGMSSIISYLPDEKIGIIVLSNKMTDAPSLIRTKFLEIFHKNKH
jgi:CubicO group peptidase (beta-lactamase class C family)